MWKAFCQPLGATSSLRLPEYYPESNGQNERCNHELETALRCVINNYPSTRSQHLQWIEYAHNSQTSAATGKSYFEASVGYAPPLSPSQETNVRVPSVQHDIRHCRRVWRQTEALLELQNKIRSSLTDTYPWLQSWLSTKDITLKDTQGNLHLGSLVHFL